MKSRTTPPGWLTFSASSAVARSSSVRPSAARRSSSASTTTSGSRPPRSLAAAIPCTPSRRGFSQRWASCRRSSSGRSPDKRQAHDGVEGGVEAQHPRHVGLARQLDQAEALAHVDGGEVHVLPPVELEDHLRDTGTRGRAHLADAGDDADRLLDRPADELLDRQRRGVGVLRLDREGRVGEVGEELRPAVGAPPASRRCRPPASPSARRSAGVPSPR